MEPRKHNRFHRLIRIVQEIKTHPAQTLGELSKKIGVGKSQFYKDKESLRRLGFDFHFDRGAKRFVVTMDAFLPVENLSLSEIVSLIMAVRQLSAAGDYILTYEGVRAARKLAAGLPQDHRENALALFDDLVLKEGFGCSRNILESLQKAVVENRRVEILHEKPGDDAPKRHVIEPYHLFFRRRALYVEGYSIDEKEIRTYRVSRICRVDSTPYSFSLRKEGYDFSKRQKNAFSAFPGESVQKVSVLFSKKIRPFIEESLWHHSQIVTPRENGDVVFEVRVAHPREVLWWALSWGEHAEILAPQWLRREALGTISKMKLKYGKS